MATPRLRMGLMGFSAEEYMVALLRTRSALLKWEVSKIEDADALWVNGESVAMVSHDLVRVAGNGSQPEVLLDLKHLARPTAFTTPIADERIRPPVTFDSRNAISVDKVLRRAETVLQPLVMQLAVAAQMAERLAELTSETYHLVRGGKLVAVVNVGGSIGIDLTLTPLHVEEAVWKGLPAAAGEIPSSFFATTFSEVLWVYVSRVETDLLPRRYRTAKLYFRAIPRVSQRHITNTHYQILSELASEPQNFRRLQHAIGLRKDALANALSMLYYAGSITTDPARATKGAARVADADSPSELRHSLFPESTAADLSGADGQGKRTLPIPLDLP
jgi:DNA-binding transcriptional ArsR family regulator